MKVIDVSEFQGQIDWDKVKADDIEGVIIRAGYGKGNVDEGFVDNIKGAIEAKMHIGIYWFSYAFNDDMATQEAIYCCDLIGPYKGSIDMPVFFDWEYDSMRYAEEKGAYIGRELVSTMTRAFCEEVEKAGYTAGYYLNLDYSENYYNEELLKGFKRWFAYYDDEPFQDCYLWQSTSHGLVNGILGDVDMDVLYGDLCPCNSEEVNNIDNQDEEAGESSEGNQEEAYKVGEVYTVNVKSALNVRTGPGINSPRVGYDGLTSDGKKHANTWGALFPGTRVTCLEVDKKSDDDIWIRIPSGWVCAVSGDNRYIV